MTDRPMVKLHPAAHDWAASMSRGEDLPDEVSQDTLDAVLRLKATGHKFSEISREAPECLSTSGAHLVFKTALRQMTARALNGPRRPFDGKPQPPAWTPSGSRLAAELRPTERPTP